VKVFSSYQPTLLNQTEQNLPLPPATIKLQRKSEMEPSVVTLDHFEYLFDIKYRSTLCFASNASLQEVINHCPFILRCPRIVTENYELTTLYKKELDNATLAPVYVKWIDNTLQYGLFADADIEEGTFIGEYVGLIHRLYHHHPVGNNYCFQYPSKWWSWHYFVIDALGEGNLTRFINHNNEPNLRPACLVEDQLLHQVFIARSKILKDTELTFHYGN